MRPNKRRRLKSLRYFFFFYKTREVPLKMLEEKKKAPYTKGIKFLFYLLLKYIYNIACLNIIYLKYLKKGFVAFVALF